MTYQIIQNDILNWTKEYRGEPYHALLLSGYKRQLKNQRGITLLLSLKFGLSFSMTGMAKGLKVAQIISGPKVSLKAPKGYFVMNCKGLSVFSLALFLGKAAVLAGVVISLNRLASLSIPVRPVPVGPIAVYKAGMVFFHPVFISALAATVFTNSPFALLGLPDNKNLFAVKASRFYHPFFGPLLYGLILTLWRAMFTPTVPETAWDNVKSLIAILANSGNRFFHHYLKIKLPRWLGAVVEAATHKAFGGAERIITDIRLNKKCAQSGLSCFDTDIIARGF